MSAKKKKKAQAGRASKPPSRPPNRPVDALHQAAREERWEARRLPLMFGGILAVVLVSRMEGIRDRAGQVGAYAIPVAFAFLAIRPFRESALWTAALGVALGASAICCVTVAGVIGSEHATRDLLIALLVAAPVAGAVLQGYGARIGVRSYCAAWLGIAAQFSYFLAGHRNAGHDSFDALLGAGLVALFVGGGVGFALGVIVTQLGKRG